MNRIAAGVIIALSVVWLGFGMLAIVRGLILGRKRRHALIAGLRAIGLEELSDKAESESCVVLTDFGFGAEAWFLPQGQEEVDLESRTYRKGFLIFPLPKHSKLKVACERYAIKLKTVARRSLGH